MSTLDDAGQRPSPSRGTRPGPRPDPDASRDAQAVEAANNGAPAGGAAPRRCSTSATWRSYYGDNAALDGTTLKIYRNLVTAVIGPSGCGKSTFIRSLNRMNDAIPGFRLAGQVLYHGHDVYGGRRQPGRGPPPDRDGVPEAEPVPEVDLRQRRLGAAQPRHASPTSTTGSSGR